VRKIFKYFNQMRSSEESVMVLAVEVTNNYGGMGIAKESSGYIFIPQKTYNKRNQPTHTSILKLVRMNTELANNVVIFMDVKHNGRFYTYGFVPILL
jgi:hypothetical protein